MRALPYLARERSRTRPDSPLLVRLKQLVRLSLPPRVTAAALRLLKPGIRFTGPYSSWETASAGSSGYSSQAILDCAVQQATGPTGTVQAPGERLRHSWPVLAGLLHAAAADGRLSVLDFGGGLGASYFSLRGFLGPRALRWSVVEQPHFVQQGFQLFHDETLRFYASPDEAVADDPPNVLLLSGVLQYLPAPIAQLERLLALGIPRIIVDRTLLLEGEEDVIAVQRLPASLGGIRLPCWFFACDRFAARFAGYQLLAAFDSTFDAGLSLGRRPASARGFIFEKTR